MSKGVLEFDLPEEQKELTLALEAQRWQGVAWEMDQWLRGLGKYGSDEPFDPDVVRQYLREAMEERGLWWE